MVEGETHELTQACVEQTAVPIVAEVNTAQAQQEPMWWLDLRSPSHRELRQAQVEAIAEGTFIPEGKLNPADLYVQPRTNKVYLPERLRDKLMFVTDVNGVHQGVGRTLAVLRQWYYWPYIV
eukprot:GHVS01033295.1.p1 GENE.GHVS01033295.1~~GHVS01033295.1.p1  ORF type:complete len:122 (-),score=6.83 GHVS01033295.1:105-470(-)